MMVVLLQTIIIAPGIFDDLSLLAFVLPTDESIFGFVEGMHQTTNVHNYQENFSVKMPSITPSYLGRFAASLGMTNVPEVLSVNATGTK